MKKIRLLTILIPLILLCGCKVLADKRYSNVNLSSDLYIYTDEDTCVQYFVSNGFYNSGNVSPRFNQDGTLKLNEECVKEKCK